MSGCTKALQPVILPFSGFAHHIIKPTDDDRSENQSLWDNMADELVELIACHLVPGMLMDMELKASIRLNHR